MPIALYTRAVVLPRDVLDPAPGQSDVHLGLLELLS